MGGIDRMKFTIGAFADLHEINKKTLMWYDEVGLLAPAEVGENGYRYYTYRQSGTLETILMLRELGVSIPEIRSFLARRSPETMAVLLAEQEKALTRKLRDLQRLRRAVGDRRREMEVLAGLDVGAITLVDRPRGRYLATVPLTAEGDFAAAVTALLSLAKDHRLRCLRDGAYGSMLPVEAVFRGEFDSYDALYVAVPAGETRQGLHCQPPGRYLRAFCRGSWDHLPETYRRVLDYAAAHRLTLSGHAYETGINETVITDESDYLTEILIPVAE